MFNSICIATLLKDRINDSCFFPVNLLSDVKDKMSNFIVSMAWAAFQLCCHCLFRTGLSTGLTHYRFKSNYKDAESSGLHKSIWKARKPVFHESGH